MCPAWGRVLEECEECEIFTDKPKPHGHERAGSRLRVVHPRATATDVPSASFVGDWRTGEIAQLGWMSRASRTTCGWARRQLL